MAKKPGNPGFFHPEIIKSAAKLLKMSLANEWFPIAALGVAIRGPNADELNRDRNSMKRC